MPADSMEKQTASPIAGAPANGSHTPDKPKNASEHRKVRTYKFFLMISIYFQGIHHIFMFSFFPLPVFQTHHGKTPESENQRKFGTAEDSYLRRT